MIFTLKLKYICHPTEIKFYGTGEIQNANFSDIILLKSQSFKINFSDRREKYTNEKIMASKPSNKDPQQIVLKYMADQNRPYSTNDIVMNLRKEFGKTAVQNALDNLVIEKKLTEKVNGKQKVYVINQESLPTANQKELAALETQIREAEDDLR